MKYEMRWRVDADGILRFALELGEEQANKFVCLTVASIEPPPDNSPLSLEERRELLKDLAGKWQGDFERPPQGEEVRVGANGLLTLRLGQVNANKVVRVTVEGVGAASNEAPLSDEEWSRRVKELAGAWVGDLERPPQGEYEQRKELS